MNFSLDPRLKTVIDDVKEIVMFAHVADIKVRNILEQELEDEDSVCYALSVTQVALEEDTNNEDVDYTVLDARLSAFNEAYDWWNEEGNGFKAIQSLKEVWSV